MMYDSNEIGLSQVIDGSWQMGRLLAEYRWDLFISAVSDWLRADS